MMPRVDAELFDRADGYLTCELWGFAELHKAHLLTKCPVLGLVATGLAHQPYRCVGGRLGPASL